MKQLIYIILFLIISNYSISQTLFKFDSLQFELKKAPENKKARIYNELSWNYRNSEPTKSVKYGKTALDLTVKFDDFEEQAKAYSYLGVAFRNLGDFKLSLAYYKLGLDVCEKNNLTEQKGFAYINIGNSYLYENDYLSAMQYLNKALNIAERINNTQIKAYYNLNIGRAYLLKKEYDIALLFFEKALKIREDAKDEFGKSVCFKYIADAKREKNELEAAIIYYNLAYKNADKKFDKEQVTDIFNRLAEINIELSNLEKASEYAKKGLEIALETKNSARIKAAYETMALLGAKNRNIDQVIRYQDMVKAYNDSVYIKQIGEKTFTLVFNNEKERMQMLFLANQKESELKDKTLKQERNIQIFLGIALLLTIILVFVVLHNNKHKKRANILLKKQHQEIIEKNEELNSRNEEIQTQRDEILTQNTLLKKQHQEIIEKNEELNSRTEEIQAQQDEIIKQKELAEEQRDEITKQKLNTTASIEYALRIQKAILPPETLMKELFPEHFIFYLPRDIVSGDFYWTTKLDDKIVITLADCTGHGVPGAFVSMLGVSMLNDIVLKRNILNPAQILEEMREQLKTALRQSFDKDSQDDGIDMALCVIDTKTLMMDFAGANNGVYLIRNKELTLIRPTLNPVGINFKEIPFVNNEVQLQTDDLLYITTDGYTDQFGGADNRRFMTQNFREMLLEIQNDSLEMQKTIIENRFTNWKGNTRQIDDVSLMGIKIKY